MTIAYSQINYFIKEKGKGQIEMKFYSFGKKENPVIMLLPGTCCHWKRNFESVIPYLEKDYYVVCVSYDGFDETEDSIFLDMIKETEKIEQYIKDNFAGEIHAAYGCSMGGSFVGLLVQRKVVHIEHGILGSSDLDQETGMGAKFKAWLIAQVLYSVFQKGKLPGFFQKRLEQKDPEQRAYMDKMLVMFGMGDTSMSFVKKKSIRNQFYSDLVTPLEDKISMEGSTIHVFYAKKMGEMYMERYQKHFENPCIHEHDLQHEELLILYPEKWAEEVKKVTKVSGKNSQ